jgi:transposase-like protein
MTAPKKLETKVSVKFSLKRERELNEDHKIVNCPHPYKLVKDGFNHVRSGKKQRYKCTLCGSRPGNKDSIDKVKKYRHSVKELIYDLFFMKAPVSSIAEKYGIPQPKVSTFKKRVIRQTYWQNREKLEHPHRNLPDGVMFADETFFGGKDNHNMEVEYVSGDSEVLAIGPVEQEGLYRYLSDTFYSMDESIRSNLRIFISDGEPAYKRLMMGLGKHIIHIQQLHDPDKRGTILINKYENLGAHTIQYQIETHWKIFSKGKHRLKVNWSIKLIRGQMHKKRGRPTKEQVKAAWSAYHGRQWRQKYDMYRELKLGKEGTAELFINPETNKVSLGAGSHTWMADMLTPLLKLFKGKCVSSNVVEGVHSRIKRHRHLRKQQDPVYQHQEFVLYAYVSEHGHLPSATLYGKYLWKYLTEPGENEGISYELRSPEQHIVQSSLMAFAST